MKKFLSIILAVSIVFAMMSFLSTVAFAAGETVIALDENGEQVGAYTDLSTAVNKELPSNTPAKTRTFKLIGNTTSGSLVPYYQTNNCNITFDLNNFKVTITQGSGFRFFAPSGCSNSVVSWKNGTIEYDGTNLVTLFWCRPNSTMNFDNVNVNITETAVLNGWAYGSHAFVYTGDASKTVVNINNSVLNINNATEAVGANNLSGSSSLSGKPTVTITDSTITNYNNGLFKDAVAKYILVSGTFNAVNGTNGTNYTVAADSEIMTNEAGKLVLRAKDAHPLAVNVLMLEGAAIRLNTKTGLRFYANVDKAAIAALEEQGATVSMGTLIAPADLLGERKLSFELDEDDYINVPYLAAEYYTDKNMTDGGIVGSIVDIIESNAYSVLSGNITRSFVARAYVSVTLNDETYVSYAPNWENTSRSVQYVASGIVENESGSEMYLAHKTDIDRWATAVK